MSVAEINSLYAAAIAGLEAGNYQLAIVKALACKMRLATTPNIARMLAGGGNEAMQWANAAAIDSFIAECKKLQSAAAAASNGIQRTKLVYRRPGNCD